MGCVDYFKCNSPKTRIVAVDAEGSVTFGRPAGRRFIPGLGTSRRPQIFIDSPSLEKATVSEPETIAMCRRVAADYGLLVGGSTGTALVVTERVAANLGPGSTIVAVSPDLGDRYLDTVYSDTWTSRHYPEVFQMLSRRETDA